MKNFKLLTLLWFVLFAWTLAGCWNKNVNNEVTDNSWDVVTVENSNTESDAVITYNDTLVELASRCLASEDAVWTAYDNESSAEDVKASINNTINECKSAWENINSLWDREGDSSLRKWVITIIEREIAYYTKFSELLPYLEKEELTEDETVTYNNIIAEIQTLDEELSQANTNLISIQEQFAENHDFELESEEVEE